MAATDFLWSHGTIHILIVFPADEELTHGLAPPQYLEEAIPFFLNTTWDAY